MFLMHKILIKEKIFKVIGSKILTADEKKFFTLII